MSGTTIFDILKENPKVAMATMLLVRGTFKEMRGDYGDHTELTLGDVLECLKSMQETIEEEVG